MGKINNKTIIATGSIMLLLLGLFHVTFWSLFDWKSELSKLSQDNEGIVQMMNICTICYLLSMSFILFICRSEIVDTRVGKLLLLSLSLFFAVRLVLEFIFPDGSLALGGVLFFLILLFAFPVVRRNSTL